VNDWHDDGQAAHELQLERQQRVLDALAECQRAGARPHYLDALAAELGLRHEWQQYQAHLQSRKGREHAQH